VCSGNGRRASCLAWPGEAEGPPCPDPAVGAIACRPSVAISAITGALTRMLSLVGPRKLGYPPYPPVLDRHSEGPSPPPTAGSKRLI
jgi:hypothetical protein